jgi:myosin heavy subunit
MASEILGLFTSPEDYQMRQQQAQQNRALQFAQLNPFEKASYGIYQGAGQLGGATAGLFGMQDPQLQKISMRQQMLTGTGGGPRINLKDPNSMLRAAEIAQQFDPEFAQGLIVAANDLSKNMAEMKAKTATVAKTQADIDRENEYRKEVIALGPEATSDQLLALASKYGSIDKSLTALQTAETAKAERTRRTEESAAKREQELKIQQDKIQAKVEADERKIESDKQAALLVANTKKEIAAINNNAKAALEASKQEARKNQADLIATLKPPKSLSAGLQKDEVKDLENIDKYDAQIKALEAPIKNLTPDPTTKKPLLELGPLENLFNYGRNILSSSSEKSRAYEELKSAIDTAVNIKVSAEKGVQTDADVLRQAKALIAAGGGNDSEVTRQALVRFRDAIKTDKEKTGKIIESRRKSQGVEPYSPSGGTRTVPFSELK